MLFKQTFQSQKKSHFNFKGFFLFLYIDIPFPSKHNHYFLLCILYIVCKTQEMIQIPSRLSSVVAMSVLINGIVKRVTQWHLPQHGLHAKYVKLICELEIEEHDRPVVSSVRENIFCEKNACTVYFSYYILFFVISKINNMFTVYSRS